MEKFRFDEDKLTGEMMEDFDEMVGATLFSFMGNDGGFDRRNLTGKAMTGLVWMAMRMSGRPEATWDEARQTPFSMLDQADDSEEAPDPTGGDSES